MSAIPTVEPLDPKLLEALRHWGEFSQENAQNALVMLEAMTPLKDAVQIGEQITRAMQQAPWPPTATPAEAANAISNAAQELAEIQLAALGRWYDGYQQFWRSCLQSGEQLTGVEADPGSPQRALAAYLEATLVIARQFQADASAQAANLNDIQAAYKAWFQRQMMGGAAG